MASPSEAPAAVSPTKPLGPFSWPALVAHLQDENPALASVLAHGVLGSFENDRLIVHFQEGSFFGKQAGTTESLRIVSKSVAAFVGRSVRVEVAFIDKVDTEETVVGAETQRRDEERETRRREVLSHPRVMDALSVFPAAAGQVKVVLEDADRDIKA